MGGWGVLVVLCRGSVTIGLATLVFVFVVCVIYVAFLDE
jgi:hypothetical protein